ncbi:MAG: sensor histidine kinase [Lachnospiraceae bacterium]
MKKSLHKSTLYWVITLIIPLLAAGIVMSTYGTVKKEAAAHYENPLETEYYISDIFKENYILYKSLCEKVSGRSICYTDLYFADLENILGTEYEYYVKHNEAYLEEFRSCFDTFMKECERKFAEYSPLLDYYIEDTVSGISISNTERDMSDEMDSYVFYLEVLYDENGNAAIAAVKSDNTEKVRKYATDLTLEKNALLIDLLSETAYPEPDTGGVQNFRQYGEGPENCRIIYGITLQNWQEYLNKGLTVYSYGGLYSTVYRDYMNTIAMNYIIWAYLVIVLLAWLLPIDRLCRKTFSESFYGKIPLEILVTAILCLMAGVSEFRFAIVKLLEGYTEKAVYTSFGFPDKSMAFFLSWTMHFFLLAAIFYTAWIAGLCLRVIREKGLKNYLKENWLCYRLLAFCKKQIKKLFDALEHIDVTKKTQSTILKLVIANALILMIISSMWVGGWGVVVVYSVLLYFGIKLYVSRLQKRYEILLSKIQEISAGNLSVEMTEDLGIFNPMKEKLSLIQTGFRNAVEKEVQSQKMKTELITNVSHDLKTPLTAIITYVDLLKEENLSLEKRREYLDTLERKALRLKVLIEDLFEISKANSGNVSLHYMEVDICNLIKQVRCELADKLEQANLDVRMELPDKKVMVSLDSQKTYRVYENLFLNIAKYSLPGTRVYIQGTLTEREIVISLKNISSQEITVNVSELAERFVRGDASRNTEGSGLGLAIAKSFVELQGGKFILESDGDLFKVTTSFPIILR